MSRTALKSLVLVSTLLSLVACQSPRYKEFSNVKPGMEKDLVLDVAGNPSVARRWNGKDRWIYYYVQTPDGPQTREVHFQDGKAVYVGTKVVPDVSAEEQDAINDESNEAEQKNLEEIFYGRSLVVPAHKSTGFESVN